MYLCLSLLNDHYYNLETLSFIRFATLLHQCLASIKKGSKKASAKEIALASHAIGMILSNLHLFYIAYCLYRLHI